MILGETENGYPTIQLEPSLEPFCEFLRACHTTASSKHIVETVDRVLCGNLASTTIWQDYAQLKLSCTNQLATVCIDNLVTAEEENAEMNLAQFRELAETWKNHVVRLRR